MNVAIISGVDGPFDTPLPTERGREWAHHYQRFAKAPTRGWRRTQLRGERALHAARERGYRFGKRTFDIAFAAALLVLASPLLLFIALSIKLDDSSGLARTSNAAAKARS